MIKRFFKKHNKKIIAFIGVLATTICGVLGITKTYAQEYNNQWVDLLQDFTTSNSKIKTYRINITTETDYETNYYELNGKNVSYTILPSISSYQNTYNVLLEPTNISGLTYINGEYLYNNEYITSFDIIGIEQFDVNLISNNFKSFYGIKYNIYHNSSYYPYFLKINDGQTWVNNMILSVTNGSIDNKYNEYVFNTQEISYDTSSRVKLSFNAFNSYTKSFDINGSENVVFSDIEMYGLQNLDLKELLNNNWVDDTQYNDLQDNYDTLENDYNTLEENYNTLQTDYNELINTDTNGLWAYFGGFSIGYIDNNNTWQTLEAYQTFEEFKNSQYNYLNGISIDLSNLKTRYPNYEKFSFACQGYGTPLLLNALSYKINNDGNTCQNGIVLENFGNTIQLDYTNLIEMQFKVNYQNIYDNVGFYDENKRVSILLFNFEYDNSNNFEITSLNNEYNNGYIIGYQNGRNSLTSTINSLNDNVTRLTEQVANQQSIINDLNYQINAINNQYGLNNLMWTIGGLPFESFKHIWNVNFFGINIADFILGFVTTFIGIYILKKFFF